VTTPRSLDNLSWPDVSAPWAVVVPIGSCEQHGPHLPYDVDTSVAEYVARTVTVGRRDLVVAPALAYGASGEHQDFGGTLSIGTDVLASVLVELGRSATTWTPRLLFVSGHGGNSAALVRAVTTLRGEAREAAWWAPQLVGGDAHAGRSETSVMLALAPDRVQLDRAEPGRSGPIDAYWKTLVTGGIRSVSANGVLGDPTGASASEGRQLLQAFADQLTEAVERWQVDDATGRLAQPSHVTLTTRS
jgi:creatinine amidohydrolase